MRRYSAANAVCALCCVAKRAILEHATGCTTPEELAAHRQQIVRASRKMGTQTSKRSQQEDNQRHSLVAKFRRIDRVLLWAATPSPGKRPSPIRRPFPLRRAPAKSK